MLFSAAGTAAVDDAVATTQARICALNVHNPGAARAQQQVEWLLQTQCNVLILTELKRSEGGRRLIRSLEADGFDILWGDADPDAYSTALVTKGFTVHPLIERAFDPRVAVADLRSAGGHLRVAAVYGPTNGMTAHSSTTRAVFQRRLLTYLTAHRDDRLIVAGDLNVVEPNHKPPIDSFEDHDYAFYTGLLELQLADAYRLLHPDGADHSWHHDRYGSQRLDHILLGTALVPSLRNFRYEQDARTSGVSDHAAALSTITLNDPHTPEERT